MMTKFRQNLRRRLEDRWKLPTMERRVANLRRAGFVPKAVYDVGAFKGNWTAMCMEAFPDAYYTMVEPQPRQAERIRERFAHTSQVRVVNAGVSSEPGTMKFTLEESNSRVVYGLGPNETSPGAEVVELPVTTLDAVARDNDPAVSPILLKLDVQGHEIKALQGAESLLPGIEVIIAECSVLRIGPVPLFEEVHDYLRAKGFRLYDIASHNYRPLDEALWQVDAFFVRTNSQLIASRDYI